MTHVTCRLTAKNRDQLRNPTLGGNRVWAIFFFASTQLFPGSILLPPVNGVDAAAVSSRQRSGPTTAAAAAAATVTAMISVGSEISARRTRQQIGLAAASYANPLGGAYTTVCADCQQLAGRTRERVVVVVVVTWWLLGRCPKYCSIKR